MTKYSTNHRRKPARSQAPHQVWSKLFKRKSFVGARFERDAGANGFDLNKVPYEIWERIISFATRAERLLEDKEFPLKDYRENVNSLAHYELLCDKESVLSEVRSLAVKRRGKAVETIVFIRLGSIPIPQTKQWSTRVIEKVQSRFNGEQTFRVCIPYHGRTFTYVYSENPTASLFAHLLYLILPYPFAKGKVCFLEVVKIRLGGYNYHDDQKNYKTLLPARKLEKSKNVLKVQACRRIVDQYFPLDRLVTYDAEGKPIIDIE